MFSTYTGAEWYLIMIANPDAFSTVYKQEQKLTKVFSIFFLSIFCHHTSILTLKNLRCKGTLQWSSAIFTRKYNFMTSSCLLPQTTKSSQKKKESPLKEKKTGRQKWKWQKLPPLKEYPFAFGRNSTKYTVLILLLIKHPSSNKCPLPLCPKKIL